jgi:transcriptional regulator with XRE-family HTH domain
MHRSGSVVAVAEPTKAKWRVRQAILDALEQQGITQATLADRVGRSEKHVSQVLTGAAGLSFDLAELMLAELGQQLTVGATALTAAPIELKDEPTGSGSVIRLDVPGGKYPEIWIRSFINYGRWNPSFEDWATGPARHVFPDGATFWDLERRGAVTLLVEGSQEMYAAGWRAGCRHIEHLAESAQYDVPEVPNGA